MSNTRGIAQGIFRWLTRVIDSVINGVIMRDRKWGWLRLFLIVVSISLITLFAAFLFESEAILRTAYEWRTNWSIGKFLPQWLLTILAVFFSWECVRYVIAPLAAMVGALMCGASYVQDVYEIKSYLLSLRYLIASLFAIGYPQLIIDDGKKQIKPGEENLLDSVGGPGYVLIRPGNVVLFERLRAPAAVRTEGHHFIPRFETIKDIASLEDQRGYIDELQVVTKDGVNVTVRDINYRYRLWSSQKAGGRLGRSMMDPYPYSITGVRNMAYNRSVRKGGLTSWPATVEIFFKNALQNIIRGKQLDDITAPRQVDADPRGDILEEYKTPGFRTRFKNIGAQLLWCGIGHFEIEDSIIADQRVSTWQAKWKGGAEVVRANSEAIKEAYREQGRADAQVEMLRAISGVLQDLNVAGDDKERVQRIFLFRLAQLLDAMGKDSQGHLPGGRS